MMGAGAKRSAPADGGLPTLSPALLRCLTASFRAGSHMVHLGYAIGLEELAQVFDTTLVVHDGGDHPLVPGKVATAPLVAPERGAKGAGHWYEAGAVSAALPPRCDCLVVNGPPGPGGMAGVAPRLGADLAPLAAGAIVVAATNGPEGAAATSAVAAAVRSTHARRSYSHFDLFLPLPWCSGGPPPATSPCAWAPPEPPFTARGRVMEGFIPQGGDELVAEMTLAEAVEYCHLSPTCLGFTFRSAEALPSARVKVWLKTTRNVKAKPGAGWHAYVKGFPGDDKGPARPPPAALRKALGAAGGDRPAGEAPGPSGKRRYLVFTSAGDASSLPKWFAPYGPGPGDRNWDCCVVYYGAQRGRWKEYADMYLEHKGGKFENLLHVYRTKPEWVAGYDSVMVLDDDVGIDTARVNACFELRGLLDVWLLQPAFDPVGKISHGVTRLQPGPTVRFTNFIEMTCPVFEKRALDRFMAVFDPDLKGWGADWWFLQVHGCGPMQLGGRVAVADVVPCINPHDAEKPGSQREITKLQGRDDRVRVWTRIKEEHGLVEWEKVQFSRIWLL